MNRTQLEQVKKTVVFLGTFDAEGKPRFSATGFVISVGGFLHLVTAKHVVLDPSTGERKDDQLRAFFNRKDGTIANRTFIELRHQFAIDWVFHTDATVDVAIIPFALNMKLDDALAVPDSIFLDLDKLVELYDVFFLSFQPGVESSDRIRPIVRTGVVSLVNPDGTFHIDGAAFPGNSGSPVFVKPSAFRFQEDGGIALGGDPIGGRFVGLIGEYVPYLEVAVSQQTGRARVVFEENTGLSRVWSVAILRQVIESDAFQKQIQHMHQFKDPEDSPET